MAAASSASTRSAAPRSNDHDSIPRREALQTLRDGLQNGTRWVKVHAAEDLIGLGLRKDAAEEFEKELASHGSEPQYRIGIWRVLAQAADTKAQRTQWVHKIRETFLEPASPDQGHALESLGKLGYKVRSRGDEAFFRALQSTDAETAALARWVMANAGGRTEEEALVALLADANPRMRGLAAYALTYLPHIRETSLAKLLNIAEKEPTDSSARVFLLSAAVTHAPESRRTLLEAALVGSASAGTPREKCEVCAGLAKCGTIKDLTLLSRLLEDGDLDVRVAAANAILHIDRREHRRL